MSNVVSKICTVVGILGTISLVFMLGLSFPTRAKEEVQQNLQQVSTDLVNIQRQISQLKSDKQEIYQALASCNFLRETENLPIWEIDMDYIKAASSYTKAEDQVKKTLEKYKEE